MLIGYSMLLGEIVPAEQVDYGDCKEFGIVCPACREAALLSRLPIPQRASLGWTTTASTLAAELGRHGLRAIEFPGGSIPDESDIVSNMSLIATG